ncbi:YcxB family protein [Actinosynnema pretiosum]|nr:YcxB family protein [Actinosynnema pretiosum]
MTITVPYDERLFKRTTQFLLRPQLNRLYVLGAVLVALGVAMLTLTTIDKVVGVVCVVLGPLLVFRIGRVTAAQALEAQWSATRAAFNLVIDDQWVSIAYPLAQMRCHWETVARVVEKPDVWYLMFTKSQAVPLPKNLMTPEQQAEFAALAAARTSVVPLRRASAQRA